jgi:hypothetical protein
MKDYYFRLKKPKQVIGRDEQIRVIMEETDFAKIHDTMTYLDWVWCNGDMTCSVPTIDMLKSNAISYLNAAWGFPDDDDEFYCTGSGGFMAYRFMYDGIKMLSLKFELTGWEFEYDEVTNEEY